MTTTENTPQEAQLLTAPDEREWVCFLGGAWCGHLQRHTPDRFLLLTSPKGPTRVHLYERTGFRERDGNRGAFLYQHVRIQDGVE